jgi:phage FluMu gp28-like protein
VNIHVPTSEEARVKEVLSHYFLLYQEKWIGDKSRKKLCEKTRRCGLTFAEEYLRVERVSQAGAKYDAYITSKDEGLARQFIRECKTFAETYQIAATDLGEIVFDQKKGVSAFALEATSGKRIYSLSSNPDQQAGRAGDRTADEYALHRDQYELFRIMKPGIMWGGQMSIFSTHRGVGSYFNTLIKEVKEKGNPKGFSLHTIPITLAVEQGLWIKIRHQLPEDDEQKQLTDDEFLQACRDEMPDEESFLQEFMCIPEDDATAFLPWSLIVPCASGLMGKIDWRSLPGPFYVGYDVARKKDLSVITIGHQIGPMINAVAEIVMEKKKFSEQEAVLYPILSDSRVKHACIDATGLGAQLAERAKEKFGWKVTPVTFTNQAKHELAYPMKRRFEDRTITIRDDMKLHADLRSVKTETTAAGNIIFTTEAGETDGHADRFWSLALMINACDSITNPGVFARIKAFMHSRDRRARDRRSRGAFG